MMLPFATHAGSFMLRQVEVIVHLPRLDFETGSVQWGNVALFQLMISALVISKLWLVE